MTFSGVGRIGVVMSVRMRSAAVFCMCFPIRSLFCARTGHTSPPGTRMSDGPDKPTMVTAWLLLLTGEVDGGLKARDFGSNLSL